MQLSQSDEWEHEVECGEDDQHDGEDNLADVIDVGRGALRLPDGPRLLAELERPTRFVVLIETADIKELCYFPCIYKKINSSAC